MDFVYDQSGHNVGQIVDSDFYEAGRLTGRVRGGAVYNLLGVLRFNIAIVKF